MEKISLGLIGLGFIGKNHLRNCLNLPGINLVAASDVSTKALNRAKRKGVKKCFKDYSTLLREPNIDAVVIALPTHLHLSSAKAAAEAGKHILLEKPLAINISEGKQIIAAARRNHVKLMVAYPLRFNKLMIDIRRKLRSGELGDVPMAYATNISSGPFVHRGVAYVPSPVPNWWFNKDLTGGGALIDLGSHMINLLRWYFGEITDIKSYLGYRFNLDIEDHATCIACFRSSTRAVINVGWFSQSYQLKVELLGTAQHAIAQNRPPKRIVAAIQMLTTQTSDFWRPYSAEIMSFVHSVREDLRPSPSGEDALKDLEAISLAYENQISLKQ